MWDAIFIVLTLALVAIIGVLPTYSSIGVMAP